MTQKEKLGRARQLAMLMKSVASSLMYDAKDYDCQFPLEHARRLEQAADEYLKLK
jgi:hypothetical protein